MAWIKNILGREQAQEPFSEVLTSRVSTPATKSLTGTLLGRLSLDSIGQRDELLKQRIGGLVDRLDDIRSLHDEFASIVEPLARISDELSRSSMRNIELEAAIAQERQSLADVRQELQENGRKLADVSALYSDANARADKLDIDLRTSLEAFAEQRATLGEKIGAIENLERKLFSESEEKTALANESKALRIEAQAADAAVTEAQHEIRGLRDRVEGLEQENSRLQQLTEDQAVENASFRTRLDEQETQIEADRERQRRTQSDLAAEKSERERLQAKYDADIGQSRSERTSLAVKLETTTARIASLEQALDAAHRQLREREEFTRTSDRSMKDSAIARATAERRVQALQTDLDKQRDRFSEIQRQKSEVQARAEMLTKALAAKDLTIDQASARNGQLSERVEQLNAKHSAIRSELETANRRLVEDLENERSERMLAQGALDIARESRAALQKQYDALKRAGRNWRDDDDNDPGNDSNVKPFRTPGV